MKTMRNALNITADNHELVKAGYIQLPVPITITEEWLNSPSLLYKERYIQSLMIRSTTHIWKSRGLIS